MVPDTIEGWADSVDMLIRSYTQQDYAYVEFNYSAIRDEGRELVTSGGKAPGHLPLKKLHDVMRARLDVSVGRHLRPIEVHDIMCNIAEAVLAGGIRRSSLISLFSHDDGEMMYAKTPANFAFGGLNSQREMSNNSAVLIRGSTSKYQFRRIFDIANKNYGEPGFFWTSNLNYGCNPCGEIGLNPILSEVYHTRNIQEWVADGHTEISWRPEYATSAWSRPERTGFSFCNLCEINAAACKDEYEFLDAAKVAAFIGTLQASYTSFPYLGEVTEKIARREALLGVGITGMTDNPNIALNSDVQKSAAIAVNLENKRVAQLIGINQAARTTTVKPSGTASLELGCVGSGIHPHHAKRYFRRITANKLEPVFKYFQQINSHMCELKPNRDWCITFPIQAPDGAITVKQQSAEDFLKTVFNTYDSWILPGTALPNSSHGLTHNVSCTVVVSPNEWDEVFELVWENRDRVAAMTFMPRTGDKGFLFAPREEVVTDLDEQRWEYLIKHYRKVSYADMVEGEDGTSHTAEPACGGGGCQI
jgi:ribonucleoside-diphosphate reductase alpha chain